MPHPDLYNNNVLNKHPRQTSCRDLLTVSNTLSAKTTRATHYERGLVFEYHLARVLICRVHNCS